MGVSTEKVKRYFTFATGLLECLGFAGMIFGWASLVFVLKEERYFSDLCIPLLNASDTGASNGTMNCDVQDERFSLIFTLASFMNNFMTLPNGFLLDHAGTMITRLVAIFLHTISTVMIAFSTAASAYMLFPALCLLAVGGILLLMTNLQVGNLFGKKRSTVMTLYNGAFDSSSAVFLLVKVLHDAGVALRPIFLFISCLSCLHILRTYFLMPRGHIPYPLPEDYNYGGRCKQLRLLTFAQEEATERQREPLRGAGTTEGAKGVGEEETEGDRGVREEETEVIEGSKAERDEEQDPSFQSCVFSTMFLTHAIWLSVLQLRHYLFIGTLNPMLSLLARNDPGLVSQFTNAFAFTQLCGVFCAPWNGLIFDRHKRRANPLNTASESTTSLRLADMESAVLSLTITVTQCILFSLFAAIPVLTVQYVTFALQVLNRSFLYGGHSAFTATAFPARHFGKVFGMLMAISAIASLLQYPCFALVKGPLQNDPMYINIGFIVLVISAYAHPINVYLHCRRERRKRDAVQPPQVELQGPEEKEGQPASKAHLGGGGGGGAGWRGGGDWAGGIRVSKSVYFLKSTRNPSAAQVSVPVPGSLR